MPSQSATCTTLASALLQAEASKALRAEHAVDGRRPGLLGARASKADRVPPSRRGAGLLDTRQYREAPPNPGRGGRSTDTADPSAANGMIGHQQETWLLERLDPSGARWNVLGNQIGCSTTEPARMPTS